MNETNPDKIYSRRFALTAMAMIALGTVLVIIFNVMNSSSLTMPELVTPVFYLLCFLFVFLFYIDSNRSSIMKLKISGVIIVLCVLASVSGFYFTLLPTYISCFVLASVLLAGIIDMNLGLLLLCGSLFYGVLFFPAALDKNITAFLISALMCVLASKLKKVGTLLISVQITFAFFAVAKLLSVDFQIDEVLKLPLLFELVFYVFVLFVCYAIRRVLAKSDYASAQITVLKDTAVDGNEESTQKQQSQSISNETAAYKEQIHNEPQTDTAAVYNEPQISEDELVRLQILDTEVSLLKDENEKISKLLNQVLSDRLHRIEDVISEDFEYVDRLKSTTPKLYKHSMAVARFSMGAAELIDADEQLSFAIGLYHEIDRFCGDGDWRTYLAELHLPENVVKGVIELKDKPEHLILRESGIVSLVDDVYTTIIYAKSKNRTDISAEKIVANVFRVRREQKLFTYAGLSVECQQLLKLYLTDEFGGEEIKGDI